MIRVNYTHLIFKIDSKHPKIALQNLNSLCTEIFKIEPPKTVDDHWPFIPRLSKFINKYTIYKAAPKLKDTSIILR